MTPANAIYLLVVVLVVVLLVWLILQLAGAT